MYLLFEPVVTVLLVNLLIAMMGNTYSEIASIKNEWMRQVDQQRKKFCAGGPLDFIFGLEV
jgi:hypothetical protein